MGRAEVLRDRPCSPTMLDADPQLLLPQMPALKPPPSVPGKIFEPLSRPVYFFVTLLSPNISSSERDRTQSAELLKPAKPCCELGGSPDSPRGPWSPALPTIIPEWGPSLTGVPQVLGVTHFCHSPLLSSSSPEDGFYNPTCCPRSPSSGTLLPGSGRRTRNRTLLPPKRVGGRMKC